MAEILHREVVGYRSEVSVAPFIGAQVLESLTAGMYDNPLMIYREYVQNSADSIDNAVTRGLIKRDQGHIDIRVSGKDRSVIIEDNGAGISVRDAVRVLVDIGNSDKDLHAQRGFRGIGRLGGLGYCDLLCFETRSDGDDRIAVIELDGKALRRNLSELPRNLSLEEAVKIICTRSYRDAELTEPRHFFRVTLIGIRPFHDDCLLNIKMLRGYLSQVAPVPYNTKEFSFTEKISEHLRFVHGFQAYHLVVNGEQVVKPYADTITLSATKDLTLEDAELFEFYSNDGDCLARGWYARTEFSGALPRGLGVRGIRVRQGNMQVGDEKILAECFKEPRFANWHVGELHVMNGHLRPNTRRDGFEQSAHYERFLEQSYLLGHQLSSMCRRAAEKRNIIRTAEMILGSYEEFMTCSTLPDPEQAFMRIQSQARKIASQIGKRFREEELPPELLDRLISIAGLVRNPGRSICFEKSFDGRVLRRYSKRQLLEDMIQRIREAHSSSHTSDELISRLLVGFLTPTAQRQMKRASALGPKRKV